MKRVEKIFFSEKFDIHEDMQKLGIFDPIINIDSNYFINIKRLRDTNIEEFKNCFEKINKYFYDIGELLLAADGDKDHKAYKTAVKMFDFPEVEGINLGTSKGGGGRGFGKKLRIQIISDASEIITTCANHPEIFHLLSLFEENVGPDRISDMIARLIYDEIVEYTKKSYEKLNVSLDNSFFNNGLITNPYKIRKGKSTPILLLPISILHEIPIAKDWEDIDRVCRENEAIKAELNKVVRDEWHKLTSSRKKQEIRKQIFLREKSLNRVVNAYNETTLEEYDIFNNSDYFVEKVVHKFRDEYPIIVSNEKDSFSATLEICNHFKYLIEECKGYELLYDGNKFRNEKTVQKVLHITAYYYCLANNLDLSPEPNSGRGPVDFKISRGNDKTVIEIKLTSNQDTAHGFEVQIEEYAKSEKTNKKVFLMVENGHRKRAEKILCLYDEKKKKGENPAKVILIDAVAKKSASIYGK